MASRWISVVLVLVLGACPADDAEVAGENETETEGAGTGAAASTSTSAATSTSTSASTSTSMPTSASTSMSTSMSMSGGDDDVPPAGGCTPSALEPGSHADLTLEHDGVERTYNLFIPSGHDDSEPTTLVLNFHGLTSNPPQQIFFSEMDGFAEEAGVVVAYPAGLNSSWNAGACCGGSMSNAVDDVGFVRALIDEISKLLCVDPDRVFATGMSNGGFLSHRLACEASDLIAAIAPVAGVLGIPTETCADRAVPVMHFHGTLDILVGYDGGLFPPVAETIDYWVDHNGCDPEPEITFEQGDTTCETWSGCTDDADVILCTVEGGGHCWPGTEFCPFGASTVELHASEQALEFFTAHPMP